MTETMQCPLCEWQLELPTVQYAPGVAAALGLPVDALAALHLHQEMRRTEQALDRHLREHTPQQWLPALVDARKQLAAAKAALDALAGVA